MKILMFPGQGSQQKGMGKDLFKNFPDLIEKADRILGYAIEDLCWHDNEGRLNQTQYTQPAIYVVSVLSYLQNWKMRASDSAALIGHSLGLYGALFAAGVFNFETGLRVVQKRGELMGNIRNGGMLAVIGANSIRIDSLLKAHELFEIDVANYNSDTQIVLSGPDASLKRAREILTQLEFRCIPLSVSGAFHSRYMKSVHQEFFEFLKGQDFQPLQHAVFSTSNGSPLLDDFILEELSFQLIRPVRWMQTITAIRERYPNVTFQEVEPGNVLTNLNRNIATERSHPSV